MLLLRFFTQEVSPGVEFDVPVRFNSLGQTVAGIDITVVYDSTFLKAISCTSGANWPGGIVAAEPLGR